MLLETSNFGAVIGKVFTIYAAFWVLVLLVLYFGVGALMKRRERILARQQSHEHGAHH